MNDPEEDYDMEEDTAMEDEVDDYSRDVTNQSAKKTINQSGARGGKIDVMPEDSIAPADRAEEGDADAEEMGPSFPLNLHITITKPNKGATEIRAVARDGAIEIDNVGYFQKAELIEAKTPDLIREAQSVYAGPPFTNLDPDLQAMLERYLDERGINASLATFLPEYVDYKEQREYVQWLESK